MLKKPELEAFKNKEKILKKEEEKKNEIKKTFLTRKF